MLTSVPLLLRIFVHFAPVRRELVALVHYKGSSIYRVYDGDTFGYISGGDIINLGNNSEGESIYGYNFSNENSTKKRDKPGVLSMINGKSGQGNGSHFFICTKDSPGIGNDHPVFGQVVNGMNVLNAIGTTATSASDYIPTKPVIIADCGQIINGKAYGLNMTPEVFFNIAIGGRHAIRSHHHQTFL